MTWTPDSARRSRTALTRACPPRRREPRHRPRGFPAHRLGPPLPCPRGVQDTHDRIAEQVTPVPSNQYRSERLLKPLQVLTPPQTPRVLGRMNRAESRQVCRLPTVVGQELPPQALQAVHLGRSQDVDHDVPGCRWRCRRGRVRWRRRWAGACGRPWRGRRSQGRWRAGRPSPRRLPATPDARWSTPTSGRGPDLLGSTCSEGPVDTGPSLLSSGDRI